MDTTGLLWDLKTHGENLNNIGSGMIKAVEEKMRSERFKTELITNVSHDLKTPITSIVNYIDLLKKEKLTNEKATQYIEVLDRQSARLKKLTEDLVEASKASTGNIPITPVKKMSSSSSTNPSQSTRSASNQTNWRQSFVPPQKKPSSLPMENSCGACSTIYSITSANTHKKALVYTST